VITIPDYRANIYILNENTVWFREGGAPANKLAPHEGMFYLLSKNYWRVFQPLEIMAFNLDQIVRREKKDDNFLPYEKSKKSRLFDVAAENLVSNKRAQSNGDKPSDFIAGDYISDLVYYLRESFGRATVINKNGLTTEDKISKANTAPNQLVFYDRYF